MSEDNAIVVEGLKKSYKSLRVLEDVNFSVKRGEMLALLGPNGAGKTTTIRILSTLLAPDGGTALVNGFSVTKQPHHVRESIGLTGQYAAVDEYLTGFENLEMMGRLYHLSKKNSILRAKKLLQQFDLEEAQHRIVKTYSGGMRRRLDLAASLVATPPVLYLDEPTTGLDPRSRLMMWDIIKQLVAADVTILLTTQYLEEADQLADRIAVIDTGRIIAEGTSQQLKDRVGKSRLELTLRPGSDGEKAARSMGEGKARYDADERTLHIETDGSVAEIKRILNDVEQAGVAIEGLSLHKPTLDDVFMKFTGHKAA